MTHVVGESCIGCKYTDCVAVCPVECFHEGPNFLVIDPEVCIDCGVCVAECPVEAIFDEKVLPAEQKEYAELNVRLAAQWPLITQSMEPLPDADNWADRQGKREHLMETA
ncbi:MAG TPA: ferredoxin FdxA [Oxalicibacterium sp.]|uniref:ferredoxin FdxA n=1 Tax=Oxalicibacterium sp. TaxID=2766525 RepID=UPI002C3A528A|nr:ferredoxin FdxA [Oxalicibacterium sp.]HWU98642.1 ferredoxin FdxA [Oxalicibacterium sp.]HWV62365.1 ferredoxin FdxA [Oxalicibacterium sp.]